jgi:flavin-dependent dehydrogenase
LDVVVLGAGIFGAYCAEKIYHLGARNKRVLLLEAGAFLVSEHVKNWLGSG